MKMLQKIQLTNLPTPVEELPRLSAALGGPRIYIKRDDLTGLAFGGNKTRKLEYLMFHAKSEGADTVITTGAVQSNHCRQTAAAAAKLGMNCVLLLTIKGKVSSKNQTKEKFLSGNLLLDQLLGAELIWTEVGEREDLLLDTFNRIKQEGKRPYMVPYGGSNPVGASAYVFAVKELLDQIKDIAPGWIVFASSSGGTQAGITLGAKIFGFTGKIVGISVDENAEILKNRISHLATDTANYLNENISFKPEGINVFDDYLGEGYGIAGEPEIDAIVKFARYEGLLLDPVYTGRAAAGMIDLIQRGYFNSNRSDNNPILFWHTGGTPALFAEKYREILWD